MARKRSQNVEPKTPPEPDHKVPPAAAPRYGEEKPQAAPPRLEGPEMPDHLRAAQQQAQQEPPKPVKHEPAKDELGAPADAPPVPPKAAAEPVPRVIDQSERSPDPQRLTRYKVRAAAPFDSQPYRYVLVRKGDRQGAIDHYVLVTGIRAILDTFPEGQAPRLMMTAKELPD